ncbi:MAG TPA: hypothetical protein VFJ58_06530 [Armatimonadota bacterium]|nr:hypothetical protein [Armatimonadota bacterium]
MTESAATAEPLADAGVSSIRAGVSSGAVGGVVGDASSQGTELALGWRKKFSWGELEFSGVAGGVVGGGAAAWAGRGAAAPLDANPLKGLPRVGSALKDDLVAGGKGWPTGAAKACTFPDIVDNFADSATEFPLNRGARLYQIEGSNNGVPGRFEWIVDDGRVTHRMFVRGAQ